MGLLSFLGLDGRARSVSSTDPLPVDIGSNVSLTLPASLEIANDVGNPVPVSGPLTDTQLRAAAVPVAPNIQRGAGNVTAETTRVVLAADGPTVTTLSSIDGKTPAILKTPTTTSVASSATSVPILAANTNRRGLSVANLSTSTLSLSFSATATTANCFIQLPAGSFILLDQQLIVSNAISGIWSSANGTAQVTEYV
jgi:hypothetical protein